MADKQNNSDDRIEKMLRRWGADEAAGMHVGSPTPVRSTGGGRILLRWLPPAAAAVLLIAAWVVFQRAPRADNAPAVSPRLGELEQELAAKEKALREATADLRRAKEDLIRSDGLRLAAVGLRRRELAALNDQIKAGEDRLAAVTRRVNELLTIRADQSAELARLRKDKADRDKELAYLRLARGKSATALADRDARIAALTLESKRLSDDLAALGKARQTERADMREAYFAVAAPGLTDVRAQQAAAQQSEMLRRCADILRSTTDESSRRLIDRVEVVLTRLEMIDAGDPDQSGAFGAMVRSGRIDERIDRALDSPGQEAVVRQWLIEAQMILSPMEVGNVS